MPLGRSEGVSDKVTYNSSKYLSIYYDELCGLIIYVKYVITERKIMKCPICSKEIDEAANYCLGCGGKIPRCPTCNKVLGKTETFCTYDGTRIPDEVLAVFANEKQHTESTGGNNYNVSQQAAPAAYNNNANQNPAPKPPKNKIPVWIIIVLAVFMVSSVALGAVVVRNMLVSNTSDKVAKKQAKSDDDEDDETKSKKSKKKKEESTEESAEEAQEENEVMASLDANAKQNVDNQIPSYETPQATDMVPVTLPPQTVARQTPPPTTIVYYYPSYSDAWEMLDYFIYNSDCMYFTEADIAGFDAEMCRLARNGIYARLGRKFKDAGLSNFFSQYYWYYPTIEADNFSDRLLNAYQVANRDLIVSYERKHGFN